MFKIEQFFSTQFFFSHERHLLHLTFEFEKFILL